MELCKITFNLKIILIIIESHVQLSNSGCPQSCECKWKSGKESVLCTNANMTSVPLQLDAGTQLLDLTGNTLLTIKSDEFNNAGLVNLQKIYISNCRLKFLEHFAFRNIINLIELDLSYNMLTSIPSHVLNTIPELRELKLNGNPIERIIVNAFIDVPHLVKLELSDCKLASLDVGAFNGLQTSLKCLKLDHNKLSEVKALTFNILHTLHELELAANPWNCSCELKPFREWMLHQNIPSVIPPLCQFPNRLTSKSWDKLELNEFACRPEIMALYSKVHVIEGKNVTLTCQVGGLPEPNVQWLLKDKIISDNSNEKLYSVHFENTSSNLIIRQAGVQTEGIYMCVAENKAGKSKASIMLSISRNLNENLSSKKILVTSILAGLFLVLISASMILCVCIIRNKQIVKWHKRNYYRREDNYEKIEMKDKDGILLGEKKEYLTSDLSLRKNGDYYLIPIETEIDLGNQENGFEIRIMPPELTKNHEDCEMRNTQIPLPNTDDIRRRTFETNSCNLSSTIDVAKQEYQTNLQRHISHRPTLQTAESCNKSFGHTENSGFLKQSENPFSPTYSSLKSIEEGNDVLDISDLYNNFQRNSFKRKYNVSDSCSNNKIDSINDEHLISSYVSCKKTYNLLSCSNSAAHLNSTPLLDVTSLDNRIIFKRNVVSSTSPLPQVSTNSYDYHAAQLEIFLEEYRNLQQEFSKMKESSELLNNKKETKEPYISTDKPAVENNASKQGHLSNVSLNSNQALDTSLSSIGCELFKYLQTTLSSNVLHNIKEFNNN